MISPRIKQSSRHHEKLSHAFGNGIFFRFVSNRLSLLDFNLFQLRYLANPDILIGVLSCQLACHQKSSSVNKAGKSLHGLFRRFKAECSQIKRILSPEYNVCLLCSNYVGESNGGEPSASACVAAPAGLPTSWYIYKNMEGGRAAQLEATPTCLEKTTNSIYAIYLITRQLD